MGVAGLELVVGVGVGVGVVAPRQGSIYVYCRPEIDEKEKRKKKVQKSWDHDKDSDYIYVHCMHPCIVRSTRTTNDSLVQRAWRRGSKEGCRGSDSSEYDWQW